MKFVVPEVMAAMGVVHLPDVWELEMVGHPSLGGAEVKMLKGWKP